MRRQAEESPVPDLAVTDEMPVVRELAPGSVRSSREPGDGNSDVFVCRRSSPDFGDFGTESAVATAAAEGVTLFVYGWEHVEPGPLSWAFPSLRAALDAVKTMRNAVEWSIVAGSEWVSIDAARAKGAVLIEQNP